MIDKNKMWDPVTNNQRTQSLFLEHRYDTDTAIFTLNEQDKEYQGVVYPSLRRLYLEAEDLGEYEFANSVLLGWRHWQRICANKLFAKQIDEWRLELEAKMRGKAINAIVEEVRSGGRSAQSSAKWLADRKWKVTGAGRPSKEDMRHEKEVQDRISSDYTADVVRLRD